MMNKNLEEKKILIVAAHPDDEILGCGGTVAKLVKEGYRAISLILGEGVTSRDNNRDVPLRQKEIEELHLQTIEANKIIGIKEAINSNLPDNRFDSIPLLDIIKIIEGIKKQFNPSIVFTHNAQDLNVDHQITYKAVLTAFRPMVRESVKEIYSFEIPSSTEWNYPVTFSPNVFCDISSTIDIKISALAKYRDEIKAFPHPRSIESLKINAQGWGIKVGQPFTEAFEAIRVLK